MPLLYGGIRVRTIISRLQRSMCLCYATYAPWFVRSSTLFRDLWDAVFTKWIRNYAEGTFTLLEVHSNTHLRAFCYITVV